MPNDEPHQVELSVRIDSEGERAALEQALLRARATELGDVRRRDIRLVTGYGDSSTRDSMTSEADRAQLRWTMLDRLLAALKAAIPSERES
jgi:hypothetical protein